MRPTTYTVLLALLLYACSGLPKLQKSQAQIPCIGAVGHDQSTRFKKAFQKVSAPHLNDAVPLSLQKQRFDARTYQKYTNTLDVKDLKTEVVPTDSTQAPMPYYTLGISDFVGLRSQFNREENAALKNYMVMDDALQVVRQISFVAPKEIQDRLADTNHYFLTDSQDGLMLEVHGPSGKTQIDMIVFNIFDFETADICWSKNRYGQMQVATFLVDGGPCPGNTQKIPRKLLEDTNHLKF